MTGAAPSRYGSKLVLAAHVAALLGLSAAAFRNNIDMLFAGMDGVYLLTILEHQFAWLGVAAGFFASPFQGLGDLWFPWNAWLMPAYVLPHLAWGSGAETSASFRVAAFVVAAAELFVAAIVLARTLGMARLPALLGAWLVLLLTMPWSGASLLYPFMMLAPHNATALAESCLLVAALVSLGRASSGAKVSKRDAALVAAIMLLAGHLVLSQPGAVLLCLPVLACVLAGSVAGAETRREAVLKLGGSAAAALILVLAGFAVFFIGIYAYSVPRFWPAGLENDRLAWYHVSILFHKTANGWGGPLLFLGGVFGLLHAHSTGERREKRFAGALLVLIAALGIFGAATVYWDFWRGPSPLYVEFFLWPLYAIYAARSLVAGLAWALQRMKRGAALVPFLDRSVAAVALLPLVAALPLVGAASASPLGQRLYFPIPPRETAIVSYLKARVALSPGGEFNGRVATMDALASNDPARWLALHFYFHAPRAAATGNDHAVVGLWHFSIPTLLAYNSSLSPAFFRAATRLLARPEDRQLRSVVVLRKPDARVLGLFGVRYLIADAPQGAPFRLVMTQPTHPKETLHLYEVPVVNLGRLSPLVLNKVEGFERALDALADPRFDPREAALVFEELPGEKLSRATASELRVVPGGFAVKAASAGRTLLVVPFEFSRCLSVRSLDKALPAPQLVRVDALLTGVLFERGVDAEVRYFTGPFDGAGCRLRDGADLKRLLSHEIR